MRRVTGQGAVGGARMQHALDGHQLLVTGPGEYWIAIAQWLRRGTARDETLIYAADADTATVDDLARVLARYDLDLTRAVADGQLIVTEPERYFSVAGHRVLVQDGLRAGRAVRTCHRGDPVNQMPPFDQVVFEGMLDELWATRHVSTLCVHGHQLSTDSERLAGAVSLHSCGWGDHQLHAHSPAPGRLVLTGEVDMANLDLFTAVIDNAVHRTTGELTVDCRTLTHMSVRGWRALHLATAALRERAAPVGLQVSPTAAKILHLTGLTEGFHVHTALEATQ